MIKNHATANIAPGARVRSDGLACFGGIAEAGFTHIPVVTGGGRPKGTAFTWDNTGLGNTKSAITGPVALPIRAMRDAIWRPTNIAITGASICRR